MKNVGIKESCSEDWNKMSANEKGAFCLSCAKNVVDFTNKSSADIKAILFQSRNESLCVRMTIAQENQLIREFELWQSKESTNVQRVFLFSLLVVFGLGLFSCNSPESQQGLTQLQDAISQITIDSEPEELETTVKNSNEKNVIRDEPKPLTIEYPNQVEEIQVIENLEEQVLDELVISARYDDFDYTTVGMFYRVERFNDFVTETISEVQYDENGMAIPEVFNARVYPNPLISDGNLFLEIPTTSNFTISLYDLNGKFIQEIHNGELRAGTREIPFTIIDQPAGMYLAVIQAKEYKKTVRFIKI